MFAGSCWWRSLAVDGSSGTPRGHGSAVRRPGSRWHGAVERPSAFQAGHIPSWRGSYERYALSPVAAVSQWSLLLLSRLLSSARCVRTWPPFPPGCGRDAPPLPPHRIVNLLIRRSGHVVQDRPPMLIGWADIPELSTCVGCCSAPWLQSWLQSRRNGADPRLSACPAGIRRPGRVGPARALGKLTWSVARSPGASGGTRCTRPCRTSVRRRIRAPDRGCSSSLLGSLPCSWLPVAPLEGTVKSDRREFPQEMRSTLDRLWKRGTLPQRAGQILNPRGFSGVSPSSARAAGRATAAPSGARWLVARRPSAFQAGHIASWRGLYKSYALRPVAAVSGWLLLLLSAGLTSSDLSVVCGKEWAWIPS